LEPCLELCLVVNSVCSTAPIFTAYSARLDQMLN
jgi:hypothetical protein